MSLFLNATGIGGAFSETPFENWLEVSDYSFAASQETNDKGATLTAGPLRLTFENDTALTSFGMALAQGKALEYMELSATDPTEKQITSSLALQAFFVSKVEDISNGGFQVELTPAAFGFEATRFDQKGILEAQHDFAFDLDENQPAGFSGLGKLDTPDAVPQVIDDAQVNYFIRFDGIGGSSIVDGRAGWMKLDSVSFDAQRPVDTARPGLSRASFGEVDIAFEDTSSLTDLALHLTTGKLNAGAEIIGVTSFTQNKLDDVVTFELSLKNVSLTDLKMSAQAHGATTEQTATLDWQELSLETFGQDAETGKLAASPIMGFNKTTGDPLSKDVFDSQDSFSAFSGEPSGSYYLWLDGIAGSAADPSLSGWHKLDGFSAGLEAIAVRGGVNPSADFSLQFFDDTALTEITAAVQKGQVVKSATILGLTDGADRPAQTFALDLENLVFDGVNDETEGGFDATLAAGQAGLTTVARNKFGVEQTQDFGFDFTTNKTTDLDGNLGKTVSSAQSVPDEGINYYLRIDGLRGFDTVGDESGLIKLDSAQFKLANSFDPTDPFGNGGATSRPEFSVALAPGKASAEITSVMTSGDALKAVEILGFAELGGQDPVQTHFYKLADVFITSYSTGGEGPSSVSFEAGRYGLTTSGLGSEGSSSFAWDFKANSDAGVNLPAANPVSGQGDTSEADRYFIRFDGIDGESTESRDHKGWIDILSISHGGKTSGATDGDRGQPSFESFKITTASDAGLTELMQAASTGRALKSAVLEGTLSGGERSFLTEQFKFNDVFVEEVSLTPSGGYSASFQALKLGQAEFVYSSKQDLNDRLDFAFDQQNGVATSYDKLLDAQADQTTVLARSATSQGFLKLGDIQGEAIDPKHDSWIVVDQVNFSVSNRFELGGGHSGLGQVHYSDIEFYVDQGTAATQLMEAAAKGTLFKDVSLNLVAPLTDSKARPVALDIDLDGASIVSFDTEGAEGLVRFTLDFYKIEIERFGADDGGLITSEAFFGWDLEENTEIEGGGGGSGPQPVLDINSAANTVLENADQGSRVGITAQGAEGSVYSLSDSAGGLFDINPETGEVFVNAALDREATGPQQGITVLARQTDNSAVTADFTIQIRDENEFPVTTPEDVDAATNRVAENSKTGTLTGLQVFSEDADATNSAVSYSLISDYEAADVVPDKFLRDPQKFFAVNALTGVVTVAGPIDFEMLGPEVTILLMAQSADGSEALQGFTIGIDDLQGVQRVGNQWSNRLTGTREDDTLRGEGGNDELFSGEGNDEAYGGSGNDRIFAGLGNDSVDGGLGRDYAVLSDGDDVYLDDPQSGKFGKDTVLGGRGEDIIDTGGGNDLAYGGNQDDLLMMGAGNDRGFGGNGADLLRMQQGNDQGFGGAGKDRLEMGDGNDTADGGTGADLAYLGRGDDLWQDNDDRFGHDRSFGGDGRDVIEMQGGDDTATGGADADTFVILKGAGADEITDFELGVDVLQIYQSATGLESENWKDYVDAGAEELTLLISDTQSLRLSGLGSQTDLTGSVVFVDDINLA